MGGSASEVLVFPARLLDELGRFQGYSLDLDGYVPDLLAFGASRFLPRSDVEEDATYKQIIAYVLVRREDGLVLAYTRGRRSGEAKLVDMRSIGFGGHVERSDWTLFSDPGQFVLDTAAREMREELGLTNVRSRLSLAGLINDDTDLVGRVHFGFVYVMIVGLKEAVAKREGPITRLTFVDPAAAGEVAHEYEGWSRIALAMLSDPRLARSPG